MINGNGSSSAHELVADVVTASAGGGADTGSKRPAVHEPFPCSLCESFFMSEEDLQCHIRRCHVHRSWRRGKEDSKRSAVPMIRCSFCESFFLSEEDLQCHIRRCHVPRSWRRGKEDAPLPPPSAEKRPSLGGHGSSSSGSGKKGCSMVSKQTEKQLDDEAAVPEAEAWPVIDLNVPAPEVEEEKGTSG